MKQSEKGINRILVTQTGGWIGDMILLTPALRALKRAYPHAHLTLMLRPLVSDLMATHPYLDEIIVDTKHTEKSPLKALWKSVQQIRRSNFDLAIVMHPTSFRNALIPFLARVSQRIGSRVGGRGFCLSQSCSDRTDLHEVHRYLRILELIGVDTTSTQLEFWHTRKDRDVVNQLFTNHGITPNRRLVGINLGTTWQTKRWPLEKFAQVITALETRFHVLPILTGAPSELFLGETLQQMTDIHMINLIGKITITQLGALIERCEFFLSCDSGPMHIAAAVGTPTIALFGPTSPTRHRPYGDGHWVIEKPVSCRPCYKRVCYRKDSPHLCMTSIQERDVIEQAEILLKRET